MTLDLIETTRRPHATQDRFGRHRRMNLRAGLERSPSVRA